VTKRIKWVGAGSYQELDTVGEVVSGASFYDDGYHDIHPTKYPYYADAVFEEDPTLVSGVEQGEIVVNDGVYDIPKEGSGNIYDTGITKDGYARDFLKYPDWCFNVRFLSEPERTNGFYSKDAQRAIEEARISAFDNDIDSMGFGRTGNVNNRWLRTVDNIESDVTPEPVPYNVYIRRFSVWNSNNTGGHKLVFYKVDPADFSFTWIYTSPMLTGYAYTLDAELGIPINVGWGLAIYAEHHVNPKLKNVKLKVVTQKR